MYNQNNTVFIPDPEDVKANRVMCAVCYLFILFFLPLISAPDSKYGRFHANQSLILFIAWMVLGVISGVLYSIPLIGFILGGLLSGLGSIVLLVLMVIGIVNALDGKAKELPIIGSFRIIS